MIRKAIQPAIRPAFRSPFAAPYADETARSILISTIFGAGEQGYFFDPFDLSTLAQTSAGTGAVAADSDPVGRMLDLSGNDYHLTQATAACRPAYKTDGTLRWLESDSVDDTILRTGLDIRSNFTHVGAWTKLEDFARLFAIAGGDGAGDQDRSGPVWRSSTSLDWRNAATSIVRIAPTASDGPGVITVKKPSTTSLTGRFNGVDGDTITPFEDSGLTNPGLALFRNRVTATGSGSEAGGARFFGGLWVNRQLSSGELALAEAFFASRAGITL